MNDPDEQLRRIDREIARLERQEKLDNLRESQALTRRTRSSGKVGGLRNAGKAAVVVSTTIVGFAALGLFLKYFWLIILGAGAYGGYKLFFEKDDEDDRRR